MSKVDEYYKKCATCDNYALGSKSSMRAGVGFRCAKYGTCKRMDDYCNSHLIMSGYSWNRHVTDKMISDAEKMVYQPNSNCFITTAIIEILQDDFGYVVLDKLKHFRNDVLQKNSIWYPILENYDTVGSKLAGLLRTDVNRKDIAAALFHNYLIRCSYLVDCGDDIKHYTDIKDIDNPAYKNAIEVYVNMTNWLAANYGIINRFNNSIVYSNEEVAFMGHGNPEIEKGFSRCLKHDLN